MSQQLLKQKTTCQHTAFRIIEDSYEGESGVYIGYGIEAFAGEDVLLLFEDVTCDRKWIENFVEKINLGKLSPLHLFDVLIDNLP